MTKKCCKVLGVGQCTLDYLGLVERLPDGEGQAEFEQFSIQGGGTAATAIAILARWGVDTAFIGKVGDDVRGKQIIATLDGEGVDVDEVIIVPGAISQSDFIWVEAQTTRTRHYFTQGNVPALTSDEVNFSCLDDVNILLVDASAPDVQIPLMKEARRRGVTTVLDAFKTNIRTEEMVVLADYLIASERFISRMTGQGALDKMITASLTFGPRVVVITLGNEGCVAIANDSPQPIRVPAFDVDVLDRTGAGDVYHGAFIYAICHKWPLEEAVRFANVAAAHCCAQLGGRGVLPSPESLRRSV